MSNTHAESIEKYADMFLNNSQYISGTNRGKKMYAGAAGTGDLTRVLVDYGQAARGFQILSRYGGDSKLTIQRITNRHTQASRHIIALSLLGAFDPKDTSGHELTIVDSGEVYRTLLTETQGARGPGGLILERFSRLDYPVEANQNVIKTTSRYAENFAGRLAIVANIAGLDQ